MRLERISASGNRFAVADGFRAEPPADPAGVARTLAGVDGLLVVRPGGSDGADATMEVYNRDGSRPEACGNGLRCVAVVLARGGLGGVLRVDTDEAKLDLALAGEDDARPRGSRTRRGKGSGRGR